MTELKMQVSRLHKLDGDGHLKAFCDLTLFDSFVVKGFKVVDGKEGLFVSLPSDMGKDGKWYNTFMPLSKQVKEEVEKVILEAFAA